MTSRRWAAAVGCMGMGVLLALLASQSGITLRVHWAAAAIGIAGAAAVLRGGVEGERGRDAFGLAAGFALVAGGLVGFAALWSVVAYLWGLMHPPGTRVNLFNALARADDYLAWAWREGGTAIGLWVVVALLLTGAGLVIVRVCGLALFAPSRDVKAGPWGARWMGSAQAGQLARNAVGLPLGRLGGRLLRHSPSAKGWRGGHHFVVAGTRAGKGVSCVLPAIVDHDGPVVALDIKGELFAVTRRWRRSLGRRVVVLNPLGVVEDAADRFNPLDYVRAEHVSRDAAVLAEGLVKPEAGAGEHFSTLARQLIAAAVEVVARVAEPGERNLVTVADLLLGPNLTATLEAWRDNPDQVGRTAAHAAAAVLGAGDKERGSILTTIGKALAWTASDEMRRFLSGSDWSLDDLLDGKIDVFVVVPLDQVGPMAVFMRMLVNLALGTVVRQDGRRTLAKPLLLVLDEFVRLGRMEKLLDIATVGAGSGVQALFITQDKGQVEEVYGPKGAMTLLGSCATVRAFGLGRTDNATAEWIVGGLGDRTVETHGRQLDGNGKRNGSEQRAKLASVDQILELPADEMVALFPSKPPLRLKRIISHADAAYRGQLDRNPTLRA